MKKFIILLVIAVIPLYAVSQSLTPPKREVRAVWLTTLMGLDWPKTKATTPATIALQKRELTAILDKCQRANINTILFQTVVRATTIYPSAIEPWDACLTGTYDKAPGYDPLEYAISECHKRGMELQAWIVAIPIGHYDGAAAKRLHKKGYKILKFGNDAFLNPADRRTSELITSLAREITTHYDVDGIHLDYIRYPEYMNAPKSQAIADARRNVISNIVQCVHDAVKAEKPWVKVSCSVIGKYGDLRRFSSNNWNAHDRVSQDVRMWMDKGLVDQIYPMLYFRGNNFYPFAIDWAEHSHGKAIVCGLGTYFLDSHEGGKNTWSIDDMKQEMMFARTLGIGTAHFRTQFFVNNYQGIYDYASKTYAPTPALIPSTNKQTVQKPIAVKIKDGDLYIEGNSPYYNIYASDKWPVDIENPQNLVLPRHLGNIVKLCQNTQWQPKYFAVTSLDRYGNESEPLQSWQPPSLLPGQLSCDGETLRLSSVSSRDCKVNILTLQGQLVAVRTMPESKSINISRLPEGTYIVETTERHNKKKNVNKVVGYFFIKHH